MLQRNSRAAQSVADSSFICLQMCSHAARSLLIPRAYHSVRKFQNRVGIDMGTQTLLTFPGRLFMRRMNRYGSQGIILHALFLR